MMRACKSLEAGNLMHSGIVEFRPGIERVAIYLIAVTQTVPDVLKHFVNRGGRAHDSVLMESLELLSREHQTPQSG
jgi:hypothetical protein